MQAIENQAAVFARELQSDSDESDLDDPDYTPTSDNAEPEFSNIEEERSLTKHVEAKKQQENRGKGRPYLGYKVNSSISKKSVHRVERSVRQMSTNRCSHKSMTKTSENFLCAQFTERDLLYSFKKFWAIPTWDEKRAFIRGLVATQNVKRRRITSQNADGYRKYEAHDIYLDTENGGKKSMSYIFPAYIGHPG